MSDQQELNLGSTYARLRPDASVELLPVDDTFWQRLSAGELGAFHNEYLVTVHHFMKDWDVWEQHPNGDELVCLLSGAATLILRNMGQETEVRLTEAGAFALVPQGAWHTARISEPTRMLFITAGEGTLNREIPA